MNTNKIKIGKFCGTGFAEDDKEADIFLNGECRGTLTSCKANVGSIIAPAWRVVAYAVELWDENDDTTHTFSVPVIQGERTAHQARKLAEAKIAEAWA